MGLAPASVLASRAGEAFFLGGRGLDWPVLCCCCWRHFARLFLNQTWRIAEKTQGRHISQILDSKGLTGWSLFYSVCAVTWTRDSGRLILRATSSLMKISG